RITTAGAVTEFSLGLTPGVAVSDITAGPDGNMWFTEFQGNRIGWITTSGVITEFNTCVNEATAPFGITLGADGNLWFTESNVDRIGRITPPNAGTAPAIAC